MSLLARLEHADRRHLSLYGGEQARFGEVLALHPGPGLPISVALGFGPAPDAPLDELEAFFEARGLPSRLALYSHAHPELLDTLARRGYRLTRLLHAHARELDSLPQAPRLAVSEVPGEVWAPIAARAFGPGNEAIMRLTAGRAQTRLYLAEVGGEPLGVGAMSLLGGVALLFSAASLPEQRRRGAQGALLAARLRDAARAGADMAAVLTGPASASERNVQRAGFRLIGARLSFER